MLILLDSGKLLLRCNELASEGFVVCDPQTLELSELSFEEKDNLINLTHFD